MMNSGLATNVMSALYDHAKQKIIMNSSHVKYNGSCMEIYLDYGNAVIGRYGGCFEEIRVLCVGEQQEVLPQDLDVPAKDAPSLDVRVGNTRYRKC
jgi:hypothetical protein